MIAALVVLALAHTGTALQPEVRIERQQVAPGIFVLFGRGGNVGLCAGEDGAFLIDDQFAEVADEILAAVREVTDRPLRFLVNTHWHGDHTGGNARMRRVGAIVVAHENVRRRLSSEQFQEAFGRKVPPAPEEAWPVVTFDEGVTFHWNGKTIEVFHVEHAHTDGDAIVRFVEDDVFHMGDCFFNGMYPFIDPSSGGVIDGVIRAQEKVLEQAGDDAKFIAGHGPVGDRDDLRASLEMLRAVRDRIARAIDEGKTREEVVALHPTRGFDERWGGGFLDPDRFVAIVYDGMVRARRGR